MSRRALMTSATFVGATMLVSVLERTIGSVKSLPGGKLFPSQSSEVLLVRLELVEISTVFVVVPSTERFRSLTSLMPVTGLPGGSVQTSVTRRGKDFASLGTVIS